MTKADVLGLRERNKLAKERAIRVAAHELFIKNGYEGTTLRQIAESADVGFGTVLAYSKDKAGLLAMIFVEQLRSLPPLFADIDEAASLEDMLVEGLGRLYSFWARIPALSSHVLQQMEFYVGNPHMNRILARRNEARTELTHWVERMQRAGRISSAIDAGSAAASLFAIYTAAVREWAASGEDIASGIAKLRDLLALPLLGLTASGKIPAC
ncbi:TetR/AcrR family transcriptional regulator [Novosphingobium sp.]|uniref:TetR/AcrR family transcriptional regulator n=1 Tax=Novosphingobium sp. TaxID=1874826 RepID=UPI002B4A3A05|nr:TetR/AcrR family transcriptional regulator [Novosphingobium sp.]HKR91751.1 TetR/AcrR family transcriptional regulator [Novosphingobium sp.]